MLKQFKALFDEVKAAQAAAKASPTYDNCQRLDKALQAVTDLVVECQVAVKQCQPPKTQAGSTYGLDFVGQTLSTNGDILIPEEAPKPPVS